MFFSVFSLFSEVFGATISDTGSGVKSLKVSPDGKHLAAGGRDGNLS